MPRLSNLQILKNTARNVLNDVRNKLNPRTFNAYLDKILDKDRQDTIKKIISDLRSIKNQTATNITLSKVKEITKAKKGIVSEIPSAKLRPKPKPTNVLDVGSIAFFTKKRVTYEGAKSLRDLYFAILDTSKTVMPDYQYVALHAVPAGEQMYGVSAGNTNRIKSFTINVNDMQTFKSFRDKITQITSGLFPGSDAWVNLPDFDIVLDNFDLSKVELAGAGVSDKMMFKVVGIEQTKFKKDGKTFNAGDCGKVCLREIIKGSGVNGVNLILQDLEQRNIVEFRTVDGLKNYIEMWGLEIDIIANSFLVKRMVNEIVHDGEMKEIMIEDTRRKGLMRKYICSSMKIDTDIEIVYFNRCFNPIATIIFDEFNEHFDIVKNNEIVLEDNVYLSLDSKIIKDGKVLFSPKEINKNNKGRPQRPVKNKFIFFDYETVIDFTKNSCMKEYSLSILVLENDKLEDLCDADKKKDIEKVNKIRKDCCTTFLGYDCSTKFIKWLIDNQADTCFTFVGFNNVNFDNFILLDAVLRYNDDALSVSEIFYNGNQLLNFKMSGRHSTFDIHKHLMGSLSANCKSFKINCCAKKSFDHDKAQQLHEGLGLLNFITDNEELKEYNEFDVLATAVLFCKYRQALKDIEATKIYADELHNVKTIGSLIYKVFEASKEKKKFDLPKMDFQQYTDLQKCKIAGRVELFNGVQKVEERLVSTDVCSLYPYVMSVAPVYYPCGKLITTDTYMGDDVLGFYYCDIDQSNLKAMNLPKIYARKTEIENDWDYEGVLENYLVSNVIIGLLKKFNCGVVIKNGFYFTEKKKSCDMFDFLLDFMKAKNDQDTLNKNKDDLYNPALRETLKLLMNSLSGKVIEGLHTEKTVDVNSIAEYEKIKQKAVSVNFINAIGNKLFMTYEVEAEGVCKKSQRPIYLGVYVYDYAKRYMYENSYSKVGLNELLYTDTDASKFRYSKFLDWKNWIDTENIQVPHWEEVELVDERYKNHKIYDANSKVFGSFEDELSGMQGDKYVFYCVEKKSWCYSVDGKAKFRFKGLNGSALLLTLGEAFVAERTIKHKNGDIETKFQLANDSEKDVYNFANNNKHLAIENGNEEKFFEQIYTTKEAYVLCSSFRKIVKNCMRNVDLGQDAKYNQYMNKIQVNHMIKHISLKNNI
jgi:hypothetical protein